MTGPPLDERALAVIAASLAYPLVDERASATRQMAIDAADALERRGDDSLRARVDDLERKADLLRDRADELWETIAPGALS